MAQSYTRQSSFSDGDTITAALFNDEYNQLVNAFAYSSSSASSTGHRHDGTSGQGGNISQIGDLDFLNKIVVDDSNNRWGFFVQVSSSAVEQIRIQDGAIVPVTDNDIDLGTSSLEFKDAYFDGTVTSDAFAGPLTGDVTGTIQTAAQTNITSLGTLTALTVDNIAIDGTTIGHTGDTDLLTLTSGVLTVAGEVDATSLDVSGNADIDGTLEADAYTVDGVALNEYIADTVGAMVSGNTETNITVTYEDSDNTLDFVATGTVTALNNATENELVTVGATTTELDAESGLTYNGSVLTVSGEVDATSLDISGDADIDGTLEADAYTVDGTALNEYIADTVGAMVSSNTETNIAVTYEDGDNTLDFVIGTLNQDTTGTADNITVSANNSANETVYPIFVDGATGSQGAETDTGLTYNPSTGMLTTTGVTATFTGNITGNVTGNASGTAATVTGAAQSNITSLGTLTALTVDNVVIDGAVIGHTGDTDLITLSSGVVTVAGEVDATSLDISGDADIDGTLEADAITVDGTTLAEYIADTAGAMFSSNTETGITATYQDGDNTIDLVVGTLNQDTTGTASKVTVTDSTANTNFPVVFHDEGTGNVLLDDTGALRYNPSSGELLVPNLTVAGTTTQVDTVTMNAQNAIVFEGATADSNETTLSIVDPTGDHTQYLVNQGGYIPVLAAATTTQISSTPEELNILDGATVVVGEINALDLGATAVGTAIASKAVILDANKDYTGVRNFTITGELDGASLDIEGDADINGTTNLDAVDIDGAVQIDNTVTVGVDDTGYDVKFFGATASAYMLWDESEDDLILGGAARAVIPDGQLVLGSTAVSSTAAELNIMDGGTAASSTTLADADRLVVNDNGTMKQVAMTDFDSDRFTITTSAPTSGSGKRTGHVWYVV